MTKLCSNFPIFNGLIVLLVLGYFTQFVNPSFARRSLKKDPQAMKSLKLGAALINQKKFREAEKVLKNACKRTPRNPSLQFYLGVASLYTKQMAQGQKSFCNTVIMTTHKDPWNIKAQSYLAKYFRIRPYPTLIAHKSLVRWSTQAMPLKIYVTDGRVLPGAMGSKILSRKEYAQVGKWCRNPRFINRLSSSKLYKRSFNNSIYKGVRNWSWAVAERIISYQFTSNFADANVIVFWADSLPKHSGYTYCPGYPEQRYSPAVVVMSLKNADSPRFPAEKHLEAIMTHEFGHVLGLDHSPNKSDIMYQVTDPNNYAFSSGDKATLRSLYSVPPDVYFYPVVRN